jgi:hypothetical protein
LTRETRTSFAPRPSVNPVTAAGSGEEVTLAPGDRIRCVDQGMFQDPVQRTPSQEASHA